MTNLQEELLPESEEPASVSYEQQNLPFFNQQGTNQMGLGHTPSTRSAELVAGARAYLMPNDETKALSRMSGTITAQILTSLGGRSTNILWFFPARMMAIETLTERLVPKDKETQLIVDLASGFSPRALHLATNFPKAEVIEIDLPQVIAEKKRRLKNAQIAIPPNLAWLEADLGVTNLEDVLGNRKADFITAEGLTLYLTADEQARFLAQVEHNLADDGIFMCEVYFQDKFYELRRSPQIGAVASFVLRLVGNVPGIMPDKETCIQRFNTANLTQVDEYPVTDMMDEIGQPKPVDIISIMVARKSVILESEDTQSTSQLIQPNSSSSAVSDISPITANQPDIKIEDNQDVDVPSEPEET